jgi:GTP-binding protein HflX
LAGLVRRTAATLVLFDDELSPVQGKNLEAALAVRVMDRAELILDIFASRARSSEAKMQVELAQLEYLLPRLARMWAHLSRIRGGIGLRGPGETQLETDRRMIRRRIGSLRSKLERVACHRETLRRGRRPLVTAALVGYTNAGKSSLLQALSGAGTLVEDRLFATLDPLVREVDLGHGRRARLIDTVGFIRKLPHHLVASFRATLEEARQADLLLHVVDASHAQWEEQAGVVLDVLEDLGLGGRRIVHVLHKLDRVPEPEPLLARAVERWGEVVGTSVVPPQRGLESLRALMARDAYTMDGGRARDVRARVASEGRSKWSRVR